MIDRIVLYKLTDEYCTDAARAEIAAHAREVFAALPQVRDARVGLPADAEAKRSWDLSLVLRFDDLAAIEAYLPHPDHQAFAAQADRAHRAAVGEQVHVARLQL